ncbi:unnamed protein product [Closterium sp. NIES-65]|nr:unnamed protein product [Closterium sp. NIES-65]
MRKFPIGPRMGELAVWRNVFLVVRAPEEGQYGFMLCGIWERRGKKHNQVWNMGAEGQEAQPGVEYGSGGARSTTRCGIWERRGKKHNQVWNMGAEGQEAQPGVEYGSGGARSTTRCGIWERRGKKHNQVWNMGAEGQEAQPGVEYGSGGARSTTRCGIWERRGKKHNQVWNMGAEGQEAQPGVEYGSGGARSTTRCGIWERRGKKHNQVWNMGAEGQEAQPGAGAWFGGTSRVRVWVQWGVVLTCPYLHLCSIRAYVPIPFPTPGQRRLRPESLFPNDASTRLTNQDNITFDPEFLFPNDAFTCLKVTLTHSSMHAPCTCDPAPAFYPCACPHPLSHPQNQDNITFDPDFLFPNDAFTRLAHAMADAMGGPHRFDYIHVRRGDKLDARRWPHLDRDTRPEALLQKLPSLVPPNTTLYIATNEPHPHFFDPLKAAYSVYIQDDFESLWAKGSAWEAEMREVAASVGVAVGERVEFGSEMQDGEMRWRVVTCGGEGLLGEFGSEMQVLADYAIQKVARRAVETFNDLTDDPKDGEMRWGAVGRRRGGGGKVERKWWGSVGECWGGGGKVVCV